jgi:hypothetical protein
MTRPAELFSIAAIALLALSLLSRFLAPGMAISVPLRGTAFLLPPGSVCLVMVAVLCFFAAAYSMWFFRFSQKAALWHFWVTATGIVLFWVLFYLSAYLLRQGVPSELTLSRLATATLFGAFVSIAVTGLAQVIFVVNLVSGVTKFRRLQL